MRTNRAPQIAMVKLKIALISRETLFCTITKIKWPSYDLENIKVNTFYVTPQSLFLTFTRCLCIVNSVYRSDFIISEYLELINNRDGGILKN